MKTNVKILVLLLTMLTGGYAAAAQAAATPEIVGTWQGKLQVDPTTALTIQFTFAKKPDGTYSAVLNSPGNDAIKNVAANSVSWQGGALKVEVTALSGSYAGTLKSGSIEGLWTQQGSALPLTLSPKVQMAKANIDALVGTWSGPILPPTGGALTFVTRFKVDAKGALTGTLAVAEQGGIQTPMSEIEFAGGRLSFKIPPISGEFEAQYINGGFKGVWKQTGTPPAGFPVTLNKGEYAAPTLELSKESFALLSGAWTGTFQTTLPDGRPITVPTVLRFETNAKGQYVGYFDSPPMGINGMAMEAASLTAGKLKLRWPHDGGEYSADLSGNTLKGTWTRKDGKTDPLELTKK